MAKLRWVCPYCDHASIVSDENCNKQFTNVVMYDKSERHDLNVYWTIIHCPNPECCSSTLQFELRKFDKSVGMYNTVKYWRLVPPLQAKVFPSYIPQQIRNDYSEASQICDVSPKAAAALSRRCLQGMVRDFWNVKGEKNLFQEIEAIRDKVEPLTWRAIDAVRQVGNIGAHMEKDVNLIIDVEPEEAKRLVKLVEMLLSDWYVLRHEREKHMQEIVEMGEAKKHLKNQDGG